MPTTEAEIKATYKAQHDTLSEGYYNGSSGLTKEEFDTQHSQAWNGMEAELIAEGYLTIPEPARNLEAEIDEIRERLDKADIPKLDGVV